MDVERRLIRLERTNRLLLLALAVTVFAAWRSAWNSRPGGVQHARVIVADSIETRSFAVVNPYGKQGVQIAVGDDGLESIGMTDVNGASTVGLLSEPGPDGQSSICLAYRDVCRVVIGAVYRGLTPEMSIQLRDSAGRPIWMPPTTNALEVTGRDTSRN